MSTLYVLHEWPTARCSTASPTLAYAPVSPTIRAFTPVSVPSASHPTQYSIVNGCRFEWNRRLSSRDMVTRTGRPVLVASSAAWHCTDRSSFAPNAPPLLTCVTSTRSSGTPRNDATWSRSCHTPWPCEYTSSTPSSRGTASDDSGSRNACSMNCVWNVSWTTCAADARAASASPRFTWCRARMLWPSVSISVCSSGASGSIASRGSVMGSRTSYSISINAAAWRAACRVSAATAARMSPT